MEKIQPIMFNPKDKRFQCLLSDAKIMLNYLEQYNGKSFEKSDFLPPIVTTKMDFIKQYLDAMQKHIAEFEKENIVFP